MLDCSKTENFLKEQSRMCIKYRSYPNACRGCPLSCWNNKSPKGDLITCCDILSENPQTAIEIVQKWSNENSSQTLLTEFLKHYPQTDLENGLPPLCTEMLGLVDKECKHEFDARYSDCRECWNTFINEESEETE